MSAAVEMGGVIESNVTGHVKFFSDKKGWGYIEREGDAHDVFVHFGDIIGDGSGIRRTLLKDRKVEFDVIQGPRGPKASKVREIIE